MAVAHLCVLRLPRKYVAEHTSPFLSLNTSALGVTSRNKHAFEAYLTELYEQRASLLALLDSTDSLDSDVDNALTAYLALLQHLRVPIDGQTPQWSGLRFAWNDVLASNNTVVVKSAEYEVVNVLLAAALWKVEQGGVSMVFSETGLSSSSASRAFLMYRRAVGMLEYCEQLLGEGGSDSDRTDADLTVVRPLIHLLYAEIQGITVLRAIEKGNAPSLISSLALYAQQRYEECLEALGKATLLGSFLQKMFAYAAYKATCYRSYGLVYYAWAKLSGSAGGAAVRLATEAEKHGVEAEELGIHYDKTEPQTPFTERESFERTLDMAITKVKRQAESDNRHVYYERIPTELPDLPQPKQLIGSIVYSFPEAAPSISREIFGGVATSVNRNTSPETIVEIVPGTEAPQPARHRDTQDGKDQSQGQQSYWWRWLIVLLATPLLLMATLAGILVWIVLIPFKILCWPFGMLAQLIWNVVEYLIKAPLRAMLWASGAEWRPAQTKDTPSKQAP